MSTPIGALTDDVQGYATYGKQDSDNKQYSMYQDMRVENLLPRKGTKSCDGDDKPWNISHPEMTKETVARYVQSSGDARFSTNTRGSANRVLGVRNLLRPVAQTRITPGCPWFNNSSLRPSTACCLDGPDFNDPTFT